jgi:hypothetical protein
LADGANVVMSKLEQASLRRLPDWRARTYQRMADACRSGLQPEDVTRISRDEVQDLRPLLALVPPGLLIDRFRETALEFLALGERPDGVSCTYDQLHGLHELMGHIEEILDRAARHEANFPEVLQGLAGLRRWARSTHAEVPADVRQLIADQLMLAAVSETIPTLLGGLHFHGNATIDLPDAESLRRLHLPPGVVQMNVQGQEPGDWSDLRHKADAGGITLIR